MDSTLPVTLQRPSADLIAQAISHPVMSQVIMSTFDIQQMHAEGDATEAARIARHRGEAMSKFSEQRGRAAVGKDPHLDIVMDAFTSALKAFQKVNRTTSEQDDQYVRTYMAQVGSLLSSEPPPAPAPAPAPEAAASGSQSAIQLGPMLQTLLERLVAQQAADSTRPRTRNEKKSFSSEATQHLKAWWNEHFAWPYPSDSEKELLAAKTGLQMQQVNNWFINQRKRSWHKYWPEGNTPRSEEEAHEIILRERSRSQTNDFLI